MNVVPLEVAGLSKIYKHEDGSSLIAVNKISFSVQRGECFGLLGPNGAGKSTAMKCIIGFYPPSEGVVRVLGIDVQKNPKDARRSIGVCSQDDTLDTDFKALDQLAQYAAFFGIAKKEAYRKAETLLERFGLSEKRSELVEAMSGGMRRRLQVARSIINDPQLLILDEPTTGLDPEARHDLWNILATERKKGLAILLSTHYMDEAERLCDRVAIIHNGNILMCDSPQNLIQSVIGTKPICEEMRPGFFLDRAPNLEDVYLKLTGRKLDKERNHE